MLVKTRIKQSFATASASYDSVALLQRNVGRTLLQRIEVIGQLDTVVDLGCGTGFLINEFLGQKICTPEQVVAMDIAVPMLQIARNKLKNNCSVAYLCADAEFLPFQPRSVDLLISNLAFQWCDNLEKVFSDVKRILKPEGRFFFTIFGSSTLHELKSAWGEVDDYTHVNTFYSGTQLTDFLNQAGFQQVELEICSYVSTYESVWELMTELKQLGARTVMAGCNKQFTSKAAMQRMICAYQKQDENDLVPATFEVLMVAVRA
ncbi:malonyl-ACP O-methyltransferase BioC [Methyloglobulus sp.]|uniref:malonyl-ACP O-methyltransferase BioC n=1 Tax=Methyloglobulus sp. TaxID=2518622 RepID=UPI0039893C13